MYMVDNVFMKIAKQIFFTLLIFLCLFLQSPFSTNAQINPNPQGSFEVEVGGTVGSTSATPVATSTVSVTISGFASPNASIVLLDSSNNCSNLMRLNQDPNIWILNTAITVRPSWTSLSRC